MPGGKVVNRSELAELFGVALTTIDDWLRQGCPWLHRPARRGDGSWEIDVAAVLNWHKERERENAVGEIAKIDENEARRRKLAAEAALSEHELALKQGAAVLIDDVSKIWAAQVSACRSRLLGIGHKLAPLVAVESDALECQSLIDSSIQESLAELTEIDPVEFQDTPIGMGDAQESPKKHPKALGSSSKADRKSVGGPKPQAKSGSKRRARPMENQPG